MSISIQASKSAFKAAKASDASASIPSTASLQGAWALSGLKPGRSYADAARPAQPCTMKPESLVPARFSKKDSSSSAVLEISTDSEDESLLLADRPLDPGDSMYRGRAASKSRITTIQQQHERSPIQTRRIAKHPGRSSKVNGSSPLQPLASPPTIHPSSKVGSAARPKPKPVPVRRAPKSTPVIVSSDDEMDTRKGASPSSLEGIGGGALEDRDSEDLPTMAQIFEQAAQEKRSLQVSAQRNSVNNRFFDSEAEESGHEASADELMDPRDDDYDYQDPFIDDSAVGDGVSEDDEFDVRRSRRQSNASSVQMDLDEPYPGVSEDDPVEMALKQREKRQLDHDQEMDALLQATGRHRAFLLKALEVLKANEAADPDLLVDEDRQISLATCESLRDFFSPAVAKRGRSTSKPDPGSTGKGKAPAPVEAQYADEGGSDDGLSDYERRDHKRLRTALELSKRHKGPVLGEPSHSGSPGRIPTAATTRVRQDKVQHPASPKTPVRGRRQKKGVLEMMAAAGDDPATPPPPSSAPPASSPSTSGLIIESRLLPPPRVNEIPLDMSDRVIRMTAAIALYCLSQGISFKSWNENLLGPGFVKFCAWACQCPDMDGELALAFIVFRSYGDFGNLSRMDLSKVYCLRFSSSATRYHAVTKEGNPMIFISSGFCEASQLTVPSPVGLKQRSIKVILHEGEHQRTSSASCTVFGFDSMKTQYAKHAVQFSTRAEFSPSTNGNSGSPGGKTVPSRMFTGPSARNSTRVSADSFSLPNTAEVPIYDARDAEDFNVETDLPTLDEKLPRWKEEVPYGSFVVVGYTMTAFFSSSREWTLGLNIHWVIIVGIPGPKTE